MISVCDRLWRHAQGLFEYVGKISGRMEAAGVADFRNAFACIFQKAAGLEDADAI